MRALLSFRKYAQHRGVSPEAVSQAVKRGRITTILDEKGRRKIDPEVADIQWAKNTDPVQAQRAAGQRVRPPATELDNNPTSPAANVRDRVETARAELFELELAEKRGVLGNVDDMRQAAFEKARSARDALMSVPARLAAVLAAETDMARCHDILAVEMRKVCDEIAEGDASATRN